jgi:hypothetical protein
MAGLTKSLLKKSPTWSVEDGPPIFMNTIAVGPFALIEFCVTGGTTEAIPARCAPCRKELKFPAVPTRLFVNTRPVSFDAGRRRDILTVDMFFKCYRPMVKRLRNREESRWLDFTLSGRR